MGLLGTLLKIGGKVAKAGLSVATKGLSDKVISVAKSALGSKPTAVMKAKPSRTHEAIIAKLTPVAPRVRITERVLRDSAAGGGQMGQYAAPRKKAKRRGLRVYEVADPRKLPAMQKYAAARGGVARLLTKAQLRRSNLEDQAPRAPRKPAKARSSRKPPAGGLDLKAISRAWQAAGKPGSWQAFIKANPIRKAG